MNWRIYIISVVLTYLMFRLEFAVTKKYKPDKLEEATYGTHFIFMFVPVANIVLGLFSCIIVLVFSVTTPRARRNAKKLANAAFDIVDYMFTKGHEALGWFFGVSQKKPSK